MNHKVHEIKLLEDYCDEVYSGEKTFEVRKNDRGYQKGDHISFIPVDRLYLKIPHPVSEKEYEITYVHSGLGLENGYVVFGIKALEQEEDKKQNEQINKTCNNCKWEDYDVTEQPCIDCGLGLEVWEPKYDRVLPGVTRAVCSRHKYREDGRK